MPATHTLRRFSFRPLVIALSRPVCVRGLRPATACGAHYALVAVNTYLRSRLPLLFRLLIPFSKEQVMTDMVLGRWFALLVFSSWQPRLSKCFAPTGEHHSSTSTRTKQCQLKVDTRASQSTAKGQPPIEDVFPDEEPKLRPFHQNWWPLATINSLSPSKPNSLQVLGKHLVAYQRGSSTTGNKDTDWVVLEDRCSHRFAFLSKGRLVPVCGETPSGNRNDTGDSHCAMPLQNTIQCAYHGWQFDGNGTCVKVPQIGTAHGESTLPKRLAVENYPTQIQLGILWVWTDPESYNLLGQQTPIPLSPVMKEFIAYYGEESCYMRDLPYGMEILGENLLDVSHLPFSHHGVGALRRENGGKLPMQMMNQTEKEEYVKWEYDYDLKHEQEIQQVNTLVDPPVPFLQARVLNAGEHDPIFQGFKQYSGRTADNSWECTAAFYAPNHIRYRRI